MELIFLTTVVFFLGWIMGNWSAIKTFTRILQRLGITDQQLRDLNNSMKQAQPEPEASVIEIKIEQHGACLYAYTVKDDGFMGQGSTAEQLRDEILRRIPKGTRVICSRDQGGELIAAALEKNG
jgi:hypothetical protein